MRMKGNIRINPVFIGIGHGITINNQHVRGSESRRITSELLHAIIIDYAFYVHSQTDKIYSIHDIINRRKATRRMIHNAEVMHKVIDKVTTSRSGNICPLLLRGKPYAWNQEVYDFETQKFI